jgi:hypothetical protein
METKDFLKSIGFTETQVNLPTIQIELTEYGFNTNISLISSLIDTTEVDDLCLEFNSFGILTEYDAENMINNFADTHKLKYSECSYFIDWDISDYNFVYFLLEGKTEQYLGIRFNTEGQYYLFRVGVYWEENYNTLPFTTYIDKDYYIEEITELMFDAQVIFDGKVLNMNDKLFLHRMIQDFPKYAGDDLYKVFFAYYYNDNTNPEYKEYVDNYYYNLQSNQKNQLNLF